MRTRSILIAAALLGASVGTAHAAPTLRVQVDQHGDFLLIGNTLGYECAAGTPAPVVGTIANGACNQGNNNNINDTAPDLLWRSDAPAAGQALASTANTPATARSTAMLTVPTGATVTHAFLYWGATNANGVADTSVVVERPGGFTQTVNAVKSFVPGTNNAYQSVADVTQLVKDNGSGAYRVSDIDVVQFANLNSSNVFGGWSMVVFYERAADPLRNLALFEGMDVVSNGNDQTITLNGFLVPNAGFSGKLGVIAYEGDNTLTGDSLLFNNVVLTNAQNPSNNFFNGTRSHLGNAVGVAGDLPQLTGTAQSMSGIDLDVIDITAQLSAGQTSAPVKATSSGDTYYLGGWITSISTFRPDFSTSTKSVTDVNGGSIVAGDVLEYAINVVNTGNDTSINTVLTDPLPAGVTYVPGSLAIASGANAGAKTDAAGDDQGEYEAASRTVRVRLGAGANATTGGTLAVNATTKVTFKVKIDANFSGNLSNQANISAGGLLGAPNSTTPTDGNGPAAGSPPTTVVVDRCASNADCGGTTPVCDTGVSPKVCVGCLVDGNCGGATSGKVCTAGKTCADGCRGTGGNGCQAGNVCTSVDTSIGQCFECLADSDCGGATSGKVCSASNTCVNGCRGSGGNGCQAGNVCTSVDTSIGQCFECLADGDCGGATSGKVCSASNTCVNGCRGSGGNKCPAGETCSSTDASIGQCFDCLADSDCGGATSGRVCDVATNTCVDGCRGSGGNACPSGKVCTSADTSLGHCVQCVADGDCGGKTSGKVCDVATSTCVDGCRGSGGNGCPTQEKCSSTNSDIGQCTRAGNGDAGTDGGSTDGGSSGGTRDGGTGDGGTDAGSDPDDGIVPEGNGILCSTRPGSSGGDAVWLVGAGLALLVGAQRRRRR